MHSGQTVPECMRFSIGWVALARRLDVPALAGGAHLAPSGASRPGDGQLPPPYVPTSDKVF